jgi:hypothetical protein
MTAFEPWVPVRVGAVSLELPAILASRQGDAVDSVSGVFEDTGLMVLVDQGPFAPSLDADVGRPGFRELAAEVVGSPARLITFDDDEGGSYTTAIEVAAPQRITVVVRADRSVPRQVPFQIVHSVQPLG